MTRVKICGITNLADAQNAVRSGVDAIGFVFAPSPRRISLEKAAAISKAVGPWVATVGVFVNAKPSEVRRAVSRCGLTAAQLHGDESASYVRRLKGVRVIKAFRVDQNFDFSTPKKYRR